MNNPFGDGRSIDELTLPFVSLEGDSPVYIPNGMEVPNALKPVGLTANQQHPFMPVGLSNLGQGTREQLDALIARQRNGDTVFPAIGDAFIQRESLADFFNTQLSRQVVDAKISQLNAGLPANSKINYANDNFGNLIKTAVNLALTNPDTLLITLGHGLGHWDDHSESMPAYPERMQALMRALQAAVNHINASANNGVANAGNIIINVYGDFGRNVVVNNASGWDHGNNQNLLTLGGGNIRPGVLGNIIGQTQLMPSGANRVFTVPTSNSYQFEPFAIASTVYKYFGVRNPEVINGEPAINEALVATL
jgi:uncharacterized protein (DUF1501 family)